MSLCTLVFASGAWAQYSYNPNNADEQGSGTRYFGSVKDERGQALKGVAIVVKQAYVFTSDEAGRYVGYAPAENPRYAVAVVVEHGGGGSAAAAPIARDALLSALTGGIPPLSAYPAEQRPAIEERFNALSLRFDNLGSQAPTKT
jgi:hypothetical protein